MEESIVFAKKYLEDLLSFFGLNLDVYATCEEDVIELSVPSTHLNGFLIGQRGDTLRALQFMVSTALKNNEHELHRVNVDVADYKRHRNERLARRVEDWIDEVKSSGKAKSVRPMNPADRRIVHKTVGEAGGVNSESEGVGMDRHVIISPIDMPDDEPEDEIVAEATPAEKKPATKEPKEDPKEKPEQQTDEKTDE